MKINWHWYRDKKKVEEKRWEEVDKCLEEAYWGLYKDKIERAIKELKREGKIK